MGHEDSGKCHRSPGTPSPEGQGRAHPTQAFCTPPTPWKSSQELFAWPRNAVPCSDFTFCFLLLWWKGLRRGKTMGWDFRVIYQLILELFSNSRVSSMDGDPCLDLPGLKVFRGEGLPWLKQGKPWAELLTEIHHSQFSGIITGRQQLWGHMVCVWGGMSEPPRARCTQKNLQECQRDMTACPAQSRYAPVLYVFAKPDSPCASWCTQRAPEESLCTPLEYRQFLTGVSLYSVGMCKKHPN